MSLLEHLRFKVENENCFSITLEPFQTYSLLCEIFITRRGGGGREKLRNLWIFLHLFPRIIPSSPDQFCIFF